MAELKKSPPAIKTRNNFKKDNAAALVAVVVMVDAAAVATEATAVDGAAAEAAK